MCVFAVCAHDITSTYKHTLHSKSIYDVTLYDSKKSVHWNHCIYLLIKRSLYYYDVKETSIKLINQEHTCQSDMTNKGWEINIQSKLTGYQKEIEKDQYQTRWNTHIPYVTYALIFGIFHVTEARQIVNEIQLQKTH